MNTHELQPLNRMDLAFCVRRAPRAVLELLKANPRRACVAGGYIRSIVAGETVNDIDIFAHSVPHAQGLANFLADYGRSGPDQGRTVIRTDNALTVRGYPIQPQIVHRWTFEDVMDVIPSFDFTIACAAFFWCNRLNQWLGFCDPRFYQDLAAKRLVYRQPLRNEDAGGSMLRVLKFYQRGYRIPLDSLAAVIARCTMEINSCKACGATEQNVAETIVRRLREVDPSVDPNHIAHVETVDLGDE